MLMDFLSTAYNMDSCKLCQGKVKINADSPVCLILREREHTNCIKRARKQIMLIDLLSTARNTNQQRQTRPSGS